MIVQACDMVPETSTLTLPTDTAYVRIFLRQLSLGFEITKLQHYLIRMLY